MIKVPNNEPVVEYKPDSPETKSIQKKIAYYKAKDLAIKMKIGPEWIETDKPRPIYAPHNHKHRLGIYYEGNQTHVEQAIKAALWAKPDWENLHWHDRTSIFLKAADLIAHKYRDDINALTILGQSKTIFQAEIDAACELIDFLRFNAYFLRRIYEEQPISVSGIHNSLEYRPLEGFIYAITPFNFTAIGANLALAPALVGNTVLWKPSDKQIYSAWLTMDILKEAGLPDGVVNLIYTDPEKTNEVVFNHSEFAGLHFTGSTKIFKNLWKKIGQNLDNFKNYPRLVGETGGKDFIIAHPSANLKALATAIIRGAFEYQGQKCSAASRVYIPKSLWSDLKQILTTELADLKMGNPEDFSNFMGAVISEAAFDKIAGYIEQAKQDATAEVIIGGTCDKSRGYFIAPTVIQAFDSSYRTLCEEIFGPVVTIYVYEDRSFEETLTLVDKTSEYALTGSIFAEDRYTIVRARDKLKYSAGNFYINDKPTGAVVGQQPFGGGRASGTNDKAGSLYNLLRWISPRTIKENYNPPEDYRYSHMG